MTTLASTTMALICDRDLRGSTGCCRNASCHGDASATALISDGCEQGCVCWPVGGFCEFQLAANGRSLPPRISDGREEHDPDCEEEDWAWPPRCGIIMIARPFRSSREPKIALSDAFTLQYESSKPNRESIGEGELI